MKTIFILPVYNERDNLEAVLREFSRFYPNSKLLFVDDNSPDGSGFLLEFLKDRKETPEIEVFHRDKRLGIGSALLLAFEYAVQEGFDLAVTLDADLSHDPKEVKRLLEAAEGRDLVIGSRYTEGGRTDGFPLPRKLLSRALNSSLSFFMGRKVKDCTSNFRCYRVESLKKMGFERLSHPGYTFIPEILFFMLKNGFSAKEVPIIYRYRAMGKSKINVMEAISFIRLILDFLLAKKIFPGSSHA